MKYSLNGLIGHSHIHAQSDCPIAFGYKYYGRDPWSRLIFWHSFFDAFFFELFDGVFHVASHGKGNSALLLCTGNYLFISVELHCVMLQFSHTSGYLLTRSQTFLSLIKLNVTRQHNYSCVTISDRSQQALDVNVFSFNMN